MMAVVMAMAAVIVPVVIVPVMFVRVQNLSASIVRSTGAIAGFPCDGDTCWGRRTEFFQPDQVKLNDTGSFEAALENPADMWFLSNSGRLPRCRMEWGCDKRWIRATRGDVPRRIRAAPLTVAALSGSSLLRPLCRPCRGCR